MGSFEYMDIETGMTLRRGREIVLRVKYGNVNAELLSETPLPAVGVISERMNA